MFFCRTGKFLSIRFVFWCSDCKATLWIPVMCSCCLMVHIFIQHYTAGLAQCCDAGGAGGLGVDFLFPPVLKLWPSGSRLAPKDPTCLRWCSPVASSSGTGLCRDTYAVLDTGDRWCLQNSADFGSSVTAEIPPDPLSMAAQHGAPCAGRDMGPCKMCFQVGGRTLVQLQAGVNRALALWALALSTCSLAAVVFCSGGMSALQAFM